MVVNNRFEDEIKEVRTMNCTDFNACGGVKEKIITVHYFLYIVRNLSFIFHSTFLYTFQTSTKTSQIVSQPPLISLVAFFVSSFSFLSLLF